MSNYISDLLLYKSSEGFTALQVAYLIELKKYRLNNCIETEINNSLKKYHPNVRTWGPVANSLQKRGFIERGGFVYDRISTGESKQSLEQGGITIEKKLKDLFDNEYNTIVLRKFEEVFELILRKDILSKKDYEEVINRLDFYNKELFKINEKIHFYKANESYVNKLREGLRKDTWYRKES